MQSGGGTLMTPVARADEIGLRQAISSASVDRLFESLTEAPSPLAEDFRERQTDVEERLKTGDIFSTAKVLLDLAWHGHEHGLTKRDVQLLQRAEELVGGEIALVRDIEVKAAIDQIQAVLAEAMREQEPE
jgi:CarD family transcriptional regulator